MNNLDKLANKYAAKRLQETASTKYATKTPMFNDGIKSKELSAKGTVYEDIDELGDSFPAEIRAIVDFSDSLELLSSRGEEVMEILDEDIDKNTIKQAHKRVTAIRKALEKTIKKATKVDAAFKKLIKEA